MPLQESELEQLQIKLAQINVDAASLSSGLGGDGCSSGDPPSIEGGGAVMVGGVEMAPSLEGWLQIPSKQNIRRHGWKKIFVTVSSKKIIFFHSEADRQNADATLILDLK